MSTPAKTPLTKPGPTSSGPTAAADTPVEFAPARTPVAAPAATPVAIVLALAVLALGVLAVLDGLAGLGALDGGPTVVTSAATALDGTRAQGWMTVAGVVVALVGLVLVVVALKRRRRTGVAVRSEVSLWTRPADVARIATDAATTDPDVLQASSEASRKKVKVTVQTSGDSAGVTARVKAAVQERLAPITDGVSVSVKARSEVEQ